MHSDEQGKAETEVLDKGEKLVYSHDNRMDSANNSCSCQYLNLY